VSDKDRVQKIAFSDFLNKQVALVYEDPEHGAFCKTCKILGCDEIFLFVENLDKTSESIPLARIVRFTEVKPYGH